MIKVYTKNSKNGTEKEWELDPNDIRMTNRGGVGVSIKNILKMGKNDEVIKYV